MLRDELRQELRLRRREDDRFRTSSCVDGTNPGGGELQFALYTIDSLPTKEDDEAPNNINVC